MACFEWLMQHFFPRALKSNLWHCLLQHQQVAALNFQQFEGNGGFEFTAYNTISPCYAFIHITTRESVHGMESPRINQIQNLQLRAVPFSTRRSITFGRKTQGLRSHIAHAAITADEMSHKRTIHARTNYNHSQIVSEN